MILEKGNPFFANMQEEVNHINSLPPIERKIYILRHEIKIQRRHIAWKEKSKNSFGEGHKANELIDISLSKIEGFKSEIKKLEEELQNS